LITSTVAICIQHLGRVKEIVFAARRSYASAVLGVVILSVCPSVRLSVCHTRALWLIQRTYRRYFYITWKGNPCSQMWFVVQLCSSWQYFNWLKASRGPSAIAELLVDVLPCNRPYISAVGTAHMGLFCLLNQSSVHTARGHGRPKWRPYQRAVDTGIVYRA